MSTENRETPTTNDQAFKEATTDVTNSSSTSEAKHPAPKKTGLILHAGYRIVPDAPESKEPTDVDPTAQTAFSSVAEETKTITKAQAGFEAKLHKLVEKYSISPPR